jgi:hypothetical protein
MGKRGDDYYPLLRITNLKTNEVWEARGLRNLLKKVGLSVKTPSSQIHKSKKWELVEVGPPKKWDQQTYRRELYKKNTDKYKIYEEKKKAKDPLYERRKQLRLKKWKNPDGTQFTAEQHEEMLLQECMICGIDRDIVVDHCHKTNTVRGPLCRKCNLALGHANDDSSLLIKMSEYVILHEKRNNNVKI